MTNMRGMVSMMFSIYPSNIQAKMGPKYPIASTAYIVMTILGFMALAVFFFGVLMIFTGIPYPSNIEILVLVKYTIDLLISYAILIITYLSLMKHLDSSVHTFKQEGYSL